MGSKKELKKSKTVAQRAWNQEALPRLLQLSLLCHGCKDFLLLFCSLLTLALFLETSTGSGLSTRSVRCVFLLIFFELHRTDGTTNFVHSIPCSVVSIGIAFRGKLEIGVIYDPYRDELFAARRGHGTTLNGERVSVDSAADLQSSVLAVIWAHFIQKLCNKNKRTALGGTALQSHSSAATDAPADHRFDINRNTLHEVSFCSDFLFLVSKKTEILGLPVSILHG